MFQSTVMSNSVNQLVAAVGGSAGNMFVSVFVAALNVAAYIPFALQSMLQYAATQNGIAVSTYILQSAVAVSMILVAVAFRNLFVAGLVALSLVGYVGGTTTPPAQAAAAASQASVAGG